MPSMPTTPSPAYRLIRAAILRRQQVLASYQGLPRSLCPHAIGLVRGVEHCLVYQFAGSSRRGLLPPGSPHNWRCLIVARLADLRVREGPWHTAPNYAGPGSCIELLDVSVSVS
jgi:hypothetical protein